MQAYHWIIVWCMVILPVSNVLYQALTTKLWAVAFDRSYFQMVALVSVLVCDAIRLWFFS